MPISDYTRRLRAKVGHDLILFPSVAVLVFDDQGRVLLARHSEGGTWVVPGGSIEPDERPADAAVREMWEETGLLVEPVRVLGVFGGPEFRWVYTNGDEVAFVMTVFEGRVIGGSLHTHDTAEILELGYFSEDEITDLETPAWAGVVLPRVFNSRRRTGFRPPTWEPPDSGAFK